MSLTKYQDELDIAKAGQVATLEASNIKTRSAQQALKFGRAVVVGSTPGVDGKNIFQSQASITYDADFITGNSIPMTVNGVAITPVVFATSHAATFAALIAAIDALSGVSAVAGVGREILITIDGAISNITLSNYAVTGGISQPATTVVYYSVDLFEGVAVLRHGQPTTIGGDDLYEINDAVNVLTKGVVWVEVVSTVAYGEIAYVQADSNFPENQGQFTSIATDNVEVAGAKFVSSAVGTTTTPALAKVEFNLPA